MEQNCSKTLFLSWIFPLLYNSKFVRSSLFYIKYFFYFNKSSYFSIIKQALLHIKYILKFRTNTVHFPAFQADSPVCHTKHRVWRLPELSACGQLLSGIFQAKYFYIRSSAVDACYAHSISKIIAAFCTCFYLLCGPTCSVDIRCGLPMAIFLLWKYILYNFFIYCFTYSSASFFVNASRVVICLKLIFLFSRLFSWLWPRSFFSVQMQVLFGTFLEHLLFPITTEGGPLK